jgi:hypothetical protein
MAHDEWTKSLQDGRVAKYVCGRSEQISFGSVGLGRKTNSAQRNDFLLDFSFYREHFYFAQTGHSHFAAT